MKAHIIYDNYLNPNGKAMSIGGIQTYLKNLSDILRNLGYNVIIYQRGDIDFHHQIENGIEVYGYARPAEKVKGLKELLYEKARAYINPEQDLLIFGSDTTIVKSDIPVKSIAIQHGISWDVPEYGLSRWHYAFMYFKKQYRALRLSREIKYVGHLVCVDCNFINWYKALVPCPQLKLYYIPNFSEIPTTIQEKPSTAEGINIIFARRFFPKRGTRLFMNVAKSILKEYNNIKITVAGEGPDEQLLKETLGHYPNVEFIKYDSQNSLQVHADKHIAIIPTLGSEGTSLSLLEAMASGCAAICTNVGGMTNIVIDGYNGIMISPEEEELYRAIKILIENDSLRNDVAHRGRETVLAAFSLDRWKSSWTQILQSIIKD